MRHCLSEPAQNLWLMQAPGTCYARDACSRTSKQDSQQQQQRDTSSCVVHHFASGAHSRIFCGPGHTRHIKPAGLASPAMMQSQIRTLQDVVAMDCHCSTNCCIALHRPILHCAAVKCNVNVPFFRENFAAPSVGGRTKNGRGASTSGQAPNTLLSRTASCPTSRLV